MGIAGVVYRAVYHDEGYIGISRCFMISLTQTKCIEIQCF